MKAKLLIPFLCVGALALCSCDEKTDDIDTLSEQAVGECDCCSIPPETVKKVVANFLRAMRGDERAHGIDIMNVGIAAFDADKGVVTYLLGIDAQTQEPVTETLPVFFLHPGYKEFLLDYARRGKLEEVRLRGFIDREYKCYACIQVDTLDIRGEEESGDGAVTLPPNADFTPYDQERGVRLVEALRGIAPGNVDKVLVRDEKLVREDARLMVEEIQQTMRGAALTVTKGVPEKFLTLPHTLVPVKMLLADGSGVALFMHYPDTDLYYAPDSAPDGYQIRIAASQCLSDLLHRVIADQQRRERAARARMQKA